MVSFNVANTNKRHMMKTHPDVLAVSLVRHAETRRLLHSRVNQRRSEGRDASQGLAGPSQMEMQLMGNPPACDADARPEKTADFVI